MQKIVGVRFKPAGKIYNFDPLAIFLKRDDKVIVETARGLEYGYVAVKVHYAEESEIKYPIKPVVRKATARDDKLHETNLQKAPEAMEICKRQVLKRGLGMKIINAEYTFDSTKVIFTFTADGRVDFRDLVKDLASIFKIRIELRQVGVRDESKLVGGIGPCGCDLCCHKWLGEFQPVSIKMAKEQGLSLNPGKISGICGRLLCCLQYEHNCYESCLKKLPSAGQQVSTADGVGIVQKLNILKESVFVKISSDDGAIVKEYPREAVKFDKKAGRKKGQGKRQPQATDAMEEVLAEDELKELAELSSERIDIT
ncbi:MAG: stage 0 sporulation family protein [Eubacteriaceae bacterium]|jgi:cell fate regulator YaaT (PSP1 superfamily)|nr:stage 0 sporulation family protein [Eubacteriaceae bacterium]